MLTLRCFLDASPAQQIQPHGDKDSGNDFHLPDLASHTGSFHITHTIFPPPPHHPTMHRAMHHPCTTTCTRPCTAWLAHHHIAILTPPDPNGKGLHYTAAPSQPFPAVISFNCKILDGPWHQVVYCKARLVGLLLNKYVFTNFIFLPTFLTFLCYIFLYCEFAKIYLYNNL